MGDRDAPAVSGELKVNRVVAITPGVDRVADRVDHATDFLLRAVLVSGDLSDSELLVHGCILNEGSEDCKPQAKKKRIITRQIRMIEPTSSSFSLLFMLLLYTIYRLRQGLHLSFFEFFYRRKCLSNKDLGASPRRENQEKN